MNKLPNFEFPLSSSLGRSYATQKIDNFIKKAVKEGCRREDVLRFLEANGIINTLLIKRVQIINNSPVIANPITNLNENFIPIIYEDLTGKRIGFHIKGVSSHKVDKNKRITTFDVTSQGEIGYKVVEKDGIVTKISTVDPPCELTLNENGQFVEKNSSIKDQIAQHISETKNLQDEVDIYNDCL